MPTDDNRARVSEDTRGIVFLGTPHRFMKDTFELLKMLAGIPRLPEGYSKLLSDEYPQLLAQLDSFPHVIAKNNIKIEGFYGSAGTSVSAAKESGHENAQYISLTD